MIVDRITFDPVPSFYRPALHEACFPRSIQDRVKHAPHPGDTLGMCREDYQLGYCIGLAGTCVAAEREIKFLACGGALFNMPNSFVAGYIHGKYHRIDGSICVGALEWAHKMQCYSHFPRPHEHPTYADFCRLENERRREYFRQMRLAAKPPKKLKPGLPKRRDNYAHSFAELAANG